MSSVVRWRREHEDERAVLERVVRVASGLPPRKVVTARKSKPLE
jgi:hypothetical protein